MTQLTLLVTAGLLAPRPALERLRMTVLAPATNRPTN
jgi:hypothetical protein